MDKTDATGFFNSLLMEEVQHADPTITSAITQVAIQGESDILILPSSDKSFPECNQTVTQLMPELMKMEMASMSLSGILFATICHQFTLIAGKKKFREFVQKEPQVYNLLCKSCLLNSVVSGFLEPETDKSVKYGFASILSKFCKKFEVKNSEAVIKLTEVFEPLLYDKTACKLFQKPLYNLSNDTLLYKPTGNTVLKQMLFLDRSTEICEELIRHLQNLLKEKLELIEKNHFAFSQACGYKPQQSSVYKDFIKQECQSVINAFKKSCDDYSSLIRLDNQPIHRVINRQRLDMILAEGDEVLTYRYIETYQQSFRIVIEKISEEKNFSWMSALILSDKRMKSLLILPVYLVRLGGGDKTNNELKVIHEQLISFSEEGKSKLQSQIKDRDALKYVKEYEEMLLSMDTTCQCSLGALAGFIEILSSFERTYKNYQLGAEQKKAQEATLANKEMLIKMQREEELKNISRDTVKSSNSSNNSSSTSKPAKEIDDLSSSEEDQAPIPSISLHTTLSESEAPLFIQLGASWLDQIERFFKSLFAKDCLRSAVRAQQDLFLELDRLKQIQGKTPFIECLSTALVALGLMSEQTLSACLLESINPKKRQEALELLSHSQTRLAAELELHSPQNHLSELNWVKSVEWLDQAFRLPRSKANDGMQLLFDLEQARQGQPTKEALSQLAQRSLSLIFRTYPLILQLLAQQTQQQLPTLPFEKWQTELLKLADEAFQRVRSESTDTNKAGLEEFKESLDEIYQCVNEFSNAKMWQRIPQRNRQAASEFHNGAKRHLHFIYLLIQPNLIPLHPALVFKKLIRSVFPALLQIMAVKALMKGKALEEVEQDVITHSLWNSLERLEISLDTLSKEVKALIDASETAFNLNRYFSLYQQLSQSEKQEEGTATFQSWMLKAEQSKTREKALGLETGWTKSQTKSKRKEAKEQKELVQKSQEILKAALELMKIVIKA